MAQLNPSAPAFDPSRLRSAAQGSAMDAHSFRPNASAPSFHPNPQAAPFTPKSAPPPPPAANTIPLLHRFKRNVDGSAPASPDHTGSGHVSPGNSPVIGGDGGAVPQPSYKTGPNAVPGGGWPGNQPPPPGATGAPQLRPYAPPSSFVRPQLQDPAGMPDSGAPPRVPLPRTPLTGSEPATPLPRTRQLQQQQQQQQQQPQMEGAYASPMQVARPRSAYAQDLTSAAPVGPSAPSAPPAGPKAGPPMQWVPPHLKRLGKSAPMPPPAQQPEQNYSHEYASPPPPPPPQFSSPPQQQYQQYQQQQQQQQPQPQEQPHFQPPPVPHQHHHHYDAQPPAQTRVPGPPAPVMPPPAFKGWIPPHQRLAGRPTPQPAPAPVPTPAAAPSTEPTAQAPHPHAMPPPAPAPHKIPPPPPPPAVKGWVPPHQMRMGQGPRAGESSATHAPPPPPMQGAVKSWTPPIVRMGLGGRGPQTPLPPPKPLDSSGSKNNISKGPDNSNGGGASSSAAVIRGTGAGDYRPSIADLASAAPYVPQSWKPPQPGSATETRKAAPTPDTPLVVLIYGSRGAGKSTQSAVIAERYNLLAVSSGAWFKEGRLPFEELRATVRRHFGPDGTKKYNGLIMDRFIVNSDIDAYYIQSALDECGLPVPLTVWLKIDPQLGMDRAAARGDVKNANDHWRFVEQRAQAAAADKVYEPILNLETIDAGAYPEATVTAMISSFVDSRYPLRVAKPTRLPDNGHGKQHQLAPLMPRHEDFTDLTKEVHIAVGNTNGRTDSAPLSSIGGYVDKSYFTFANKQKRSVMMAAYVTLKADGVRFLIGKHRKFGWVGFPFLFQSCYDMNGFFAELPFPDVSEQVTPKDDRHPARHGFEVLLDVELSDDREGVARLFVIDFVFFYGKWAKRTNFPQRYELLCQWFEEMKDNSPVAPEHQLVLLKEYVHVNELGRLLPSLDAAPFPIDGVVFQHPGVYRFGLDKLLLKWKPKSMCTADFRLTNGRCRDVDRHWVFDLLVSDSSSADGLLEVPFPGAAGDFTSDEVKFNKIRAGLIVELQLQQVDDPQSGAKSRGAAAKVPHTRWSYYCPRPDKPTPNKLSIVKDIVELEHIEYPELMRLCGDIEPINTR